MKKEINQTNESSTGEKEIEKTKEDVTSDIVGDLFEERDRLPSEKPSFPSKKAQEEMTPAPQTDASETDKASEGEKKEKQTLKNTDEGEDTDDSHTTRLKDELEEMRKRLHQNQRFGRQSSQKLKAASKGVQSLIESGTLTQEEAQDLLSVLHMETFDPPENLETPSSHPFSPLFQIANSELEHIRKYTEDEHLQDKIEAFDFLLSVSSKQEIEDIFEALSDLQDDPVKLTRKMLALGQEAYQESYKDIKKAGGLKSYFSTQQEEIQKLQKKIDKLEKKLSQYEDYDKPSYRMTERGELNEKSSSHDVIGSLFEERDRPRRVAR